MYLVRLDLKTGQQRVLTYESAEKALAAAHLLSNARYLGDKVPPKESEWHVQDDAGRETWGNGTDIMMVQYVDFDREVSVDTAVRAHAWSIEQRGLAAAGVVQGPAPNGRAPEPRMPLAADAYEEPPAQPAGAIGRKASFAS